MIKVRANIDGVTRVVDAAVDTLSDLTTPLKRLGGRIRAKSKRKFKQGGPGWAPLAESTVARKPTAEKVELLSLARGTGPRGGSRLRRAGILKLADRMERFEQKAAQSGKSRDIQKHALRAASERSTLEAIAKLYVGQFGKKSDVNALIRFAEDDLARRKLRRITGAQPRYKNEEASTGILGGLSRSLGARVTATGLVVESKVPWSGVHNEGGTAGHGSSIPAREFLALDNDDVDAFERILGEEFEKRLSK